MGNDDKLDEPRTREPRELAGRREEMPLPQDMQSLLLLGIFGLLMLYSLYFASEIVLPIVFALVLYLLLQPSMRIFARLHIPKTIAALLIIFVFFGGVVALGFSLSGPAAEWAAKAPESLPRLERRLSMFNEPVASMQKASNEVEKLTEGRAPDVQAVTVTGPGLGSFLFR
jgi:predicted PurR-regulated permease PerM